MNMRIDKGKDESEIIAYDLSDKVLGRGYIHEFLASDLYDNKRLNMYINIKVETNENKEEIKDFIFNSLMEKAYDIRKNHKDIKSRVYHCCFADDTPNIEYYKKKDGFIHDEGMHIIRHDMSNIGHDYNKLQNFDITENALRSEEEIKKFIKIHSEVFRNSSYTVEEINELKGRKGWKNISVIQGDDIIANIMLYVSEDCNKRIGWVEDLFVNHKWRNKGIGRLILSKALEYFKAIEVDESRLEVWSANERAIKLYNSLGYKFYKETESSIGMFI